MTTALASHGLTTDQRERQFFLAMSIVIALTVAIGFSLFLAVGISTFSSPWWVHVHAVTFMAWIAFYLVQNFLMFNRSSVQHRQLGIWGSVLVLWMMVVGLLLTPLTLDVGRSPPFFTPPFFLALDWVNILVFGGLFFAAYRLRKQTDWHRRLMLCATISVIAPAWGRLLVLTDAMSLWNNIAALLVYVIVAMFADWRIRGSVHTAYFIGAGALVGMGIVIQLLAVFPPFVALADSIVA